MVSLDTLEAGVDWTKAGGPTAGGCGSVMRAYPFGLLLAHDPQLAEGWAVAHSRLTHGDPIALAACAAMARGMIGCLNGEPVEAVADEMALAAGRYSKGTEKMIRQAAEEAANGTAPEVTLDRLRGWAAHEAIAAGVYVFVRHPEDPKAAILEGANTPGDSDSIATLAGALVGVRVGVGALPKEWVEELERSEEFLGLAEEVAEAMKGASR